MERQLSEEPSRGQHRLLNIVGVGVLVISLVKLWLAFAPDRSPYVDGDRVYCLSKIKQMATALEIYMADSDDRFMPRGDWMTTLYPYIRNDDVYHCPEVRKEHPKGYGYAFCRKLLGVDADTLKAPQDEPMVFDSAILTRSAISGIESLPNPQRHEHGNNIGYVDGHARAVPVQQ